MSEQATPDEQALAEIFWDGSGESIGWTEAFKYARAILAAGWQRKDDDDDADAFRRAFTDDGARVYCAECAEYTDGAK